MRKTRFALAAGIGWAILVLLLAAVVVPEAIASDPAQGLLQQELGSLSALYDRVNPGVVSVQVFVERGVLSDMSAGSGFILDDGGHIITINHVVVEAERVTVVFYDGFEAEAEVIGADPDSDLAVLHVNELPKGAHPLALGDSDQVKAGDWVVAIGNPFGFGGSMTLGIVSAVSRLIPSGLTPTEIPQAIQTDAAINPGNSGGPLLNLKGEVIGVNAQIASGGPPTSAGVGFATPSNIVGRVAPVLIEKGSYEWPWLGVEGGSVNLAIQKANRLPLQQGAYIHHALPDSPAAQAGLRGSSYVTEMNGFEVPVGGDVVVAVDGKPIIDFSGLLVEIAFRRPGDTMKLTILRGGQPRQVAVRLAPRPAGLGP